MTMIMEKKKLKKMTMIMEKKKLKKMTMIMKKMLKGAVKTTVVDSRLLFVS